MRLLENTTIIEQELSHLKAFTYIGEYKSTPIYIMDHATLKGMENQITPILVRELLDSDDISIGGVISKLIPLIEKEFDSDYKEAEKISGPNDKIKRNFVIYRNYRNPNNTIQIGKLFITVIYGITPPFLYGEKIMSNSEEMAQKVVASNPRLKNYTENIESLNKPYIFIQSFTAGFKPLYRQFTGFENLNLKVMYDANSFPYSKKNDLRDSEFVIQHPLVMVKPIVTPDIDTFSALVDFQSLNNPI